MNRAWIVALIGIVACISCTTNEPVLSRIDGDADGDSDGDADGDSDGDADGDYSVELNLEGSTPVDLLFVVSNSGTMAEEQQVLAQQMQIVLRELVSPHTPVALAVDNLHVGVISTDLGTEGYSVEGCATPDDGDGGILQNVGRISGCAPTYSAADCDGSECPWLVHSSDFPDDRTDPSKPPIWDDFSCIANLGTGGCHYEQPLEASYQALVVNTQPGYPNEGFLREDSLLVIIYVTDGDDCSAADGSFYDPTRSNELGAPGVRCATHEEGLYPISRYYDAFVELRDGDEARVIVSAITGVPIDGSWQPGDPLEELRDLRQVNPSDPESLLTTCNTPMGSAYPPVRITELVYEFEDNEALQSICRTGWETAFQTMTRRLQERAYSDCLEGDAPTIELESCRVIEILADDASCPNLADAPGFARTTGWQVDLGTIESDGRVRRQCEILPADSDGDECPDGASDCSEWSFPESGVLHGWFYDSSLSSCESGAVRFTHQDIATEDSDFRLICSD